MYIYYLLCIIYLFNLIECKRNQYEDGFLDVTLPPFLIDNTGKTDVTIELQNVIRYANKNFYVVYLPLGIYLISDTLMLLESETWDPQPQPPDYNFDYSCRFQPNVMVGQRPVHKKNISVIMENGKIHYEEIYQRPIIRLKNSSYGFNNINIGLL